MSERERREKLLQIAKCKCSIEELEFKLYLAEEEKQRINEHMKTLKETIEKLQKELGV